MLNLRKFIVNRFRNKFVHLVKKKERGKKKRELSGK
jgi:hypothetical protein